MFIYSNKQCFFFFFTHHDHHDHLGVVKWSGSLCSNTSSPQYSLPLMSQNHLPVLTGSYFRRGMAKTSAARNGHQRKKMEVLRGSAHWVTK